MVPFDRQCSNEWAQLTEQKTFSPVNTSRPVQFLRAESRTSNSPDASNEGKIPSPPLKAQHPYLTSRRPHHREVVTTEPNPRPTSTTCLARACCWGLGAARKGRTRSATQAIECSRLSRKGRPSGNCNKDRRLFRSHRHV